MAPFEITSRAKHYRRMLGIALGRPFTGPQHVSLETTHHCNLRCSFCESHGILQGAPVTARRQYVGGKPQMELGTVQRLAGELAEVGADLVELSGKGDPIAHPQLTDIIRALKGAGLTCALVTNGTLAKPDLAPTIVEMGLDRLNVSLNAGCRDVYLRSNNKDLWDKAVKFLRDVLEGKRAAGATRPWVRISHVVTKDNVGDMDNMVGICTELGGDQLDLYVMGELPETEHLRLDKNDITNFRAAMDRWIRKLEDAKIVHGLPIFVKDLEMRVRNGDRQENPLQKKLPCYVGWNFCVIGPDGVVQPCCYCEETNLGNVNERSFVDIWYGHVYRQFRRACLDMPLTGRYICKECFTSCNRALEHARIYNRLHPFNKVPVTLETGDKVGADTLAERS